MQPGESAHVPYEKNISARVPYDRSGGTKGIQVGSILLWEARKALGHPFPPPPLFLLTEAPPPQLPIHPSAPFRGVSPARTQASHTTGGLFRFKSRVERCAQFFFSNEKSVWTHVKDIVKQALIPPPLSLALSVFAQHPLLHPRNNTEGKIAVPSTQVSNETSTKQNTARMGRFPHTS